MKQFVVVGLGLLLLWGCGGSNSGSTSGNLNLQFLSSTLTARPGRAGTACSATYSRTTDNGLCYTPTRVSGIFSEVTLSKTGGGTPARLLGGGSETGLANVFKNATFDLKTQPTIPSSDDNVQDSTGPYNLLSFALRALEVEFQAEAGAKIYRVRVPFAATPPSSSTTYTSCLSTGEREEADKYGKLYGNVVAQAGDILVCIKNTTAETCADGDYQWVDNTGALSATRPATAKQVSGTQLLTADACTNSGSRPDITWGKASIDINLATSVDITAAIDKGVKTYTAGGKSGTKLTFKIDITATNSLFVPTTALAMDLSAATQNQILGAIGEINLKSIYLKRKKSSAAPATDEGLAATATLTVE